MKRSYEKTFSLVFSEFFLARRHEKGLTKKDVAYYLHLSKATFNGYETGTRECPISVMKEMCKFYGLDFIETFRYLDQETTKRERQN